ncbi:interleukin-12 receptor subunit beta-2-like [Rana temporaria]|uniref:interleukin-12 receptor subunit beta-2-like n=1 Tax=Rana temporaria TaxID=8407 RepID=UPI001AACB79B|nr:interleukin-12 receptor subunit beta-2-like [Rana temporaria]
MLHSDMGAPPSTWSVICIFHLFTVTASEGFYIRKGDIIFKPASVVPKGSDVLVICMFSKDPCRGRGQFVFEVNDNYRKPDWQNGTSSTMQLLGVTGHHHIICYLDCVRKNIIYETNLKVGYPPDRPSNISCSLGELSSEMTCTWDRGQETDLSTSYDVHVVSLQTEASYVENKKDGSVRIAVNRTRDDVFSIQITARNQLNYSVSDVVLVRVSDIVVPITPIIRKIRLLQSAFNISIRWRNQTSERLSFCEVHYKTPTDPSWKMIGQTGSTNKSFVINKIPTAVSLRVRCREEIGNSYWSDWSAPLQVPPSAPEGTPNVWRILRSEYPNGTQEVSIFIMKDNDEIPQRTILGYEVFYLDIENRTTLRTCTVSEEECVTLVPKGVKMLFVSAFNSYGTSPNSNVYTQEESDLPRPGNLTATTWPIHVQWQSPPSRGHSLLWYVLQWNPDNCDGKHRNVSWQKLSKDRTHLLLNDTISAEQRVRILLYAVYSSGVSLPSIVEFKPESGPDSITVEKILPNTLLIQWLEVPVCKRRGLITTYTLNVTEWSSSIQYTYNSEARRFTFEDYNPDRRYSVCISASTKTGQGPDSCAFIEPDKRLQNYFEPLLGTCLVAITLTTLALVLLMIRKRIKSILRLWLPKYLYEEYPNVRNSAAVQFLQEKPEDSVSFPNPSYSDPEITDVQEAAITRETPEAHPLLQTTTDNNMIERVDKVGPLMTTTDDNMVEVGQPLQTTADNITEQTSGYRLTDDNMAEHMAKAGPPLQITMANMTVDMSGYRPTDDNMVEHMAKVGPPLQITMDNMTVDMSGYRPQAARPNLQSQDSYCSPFHLLDIQREPQRLDGPIDGSDRNVGTFQMDFSLFQGMDLQVLNDGALEDHSSSMQVTASMAAWSEHQKYRNMAEMADILSSKLNCHLPLDHRGLQDTNPYFPHMFARGT